MSGPDRGRMMRAAAWQGSRDAATAHCTRALLALLVAGAIGGAAMSPRLWAQEVVIYRCVAADGAVTLQNGQRCPKGTREQRRVVETPTSRATPAVTGSAGASMAAPSTIASATGDSAPSARDASASTNGTPADAAALPADVSSPDANGVAARVEPAPAPPIYACRTWDGERYFGDSAEPAPRCAPLRTTGLDGRADTGAQACEMRLDTCEPVAEAMRCEAWADRARRAEAALAFPTGDVPAARAELERVSTSVAGTACAR